MNRFTVTQADLDRLRQDPAPRFARFRGLFPQGISHAIEAIQTQHPPEVLLFDLPIGRAAVVICLDYIVPADREFLRDLGVTLLFVPAMSPTLKRFGNTSDPVLAEKHYCSVFCANGAWVVPDGHEATAASYVWLPAKDGRRTLADTPCRPPLLRAPLRRSGLQPGRTARP
jgi:predicted amidohydrolase